MSVYVSRSWILFKIRDLISFTKRNTEQPLTQTIWLLTIYLQINRWHGKIRSENWQWNEMDSFKQLSSLNGGWRKRVKWSNSNRFEKVWEPTVGGLLQEWTRRGLERAVGLHTTSSQSDSQSVRESAVVLLGRCPLSSPMLLTESLFDSFKRMLWFSAGRQRGEQL